MVSGDRIRQAREFRGLTQTEFAARLSVSQPTVASIEAERFQPSESMIAAISLQTGFPAQFFKQDPPSDLPQGSLLFRSKASATAREFTLVHRYAQLVYELADYCSRHVKPLPLRLPQLCEEGCEPDEVARLTRTGFGLSPDMPIPNLVNAVERAGLLVLALPQLTDEAKIDAFSAWVGRISRPVIVVCGGTPGDRLRFTIAHELGHLVMHASVRKNGTTMEKEADAFAEELLMPEASMKQELVSPITLSTLASLKVRWGVSMQALILRAHHLRILSDRQREYLFKQISARGWRTREPKHLDIPVEKPRALRQLVEMVFSKPIDYKSVANQISWSSQLVKEVLECYVGTSHEPRNDTNRAVGRVVRFPKST